MRPNPNPVRISEPLWWLINALTDLTPTSFANEHGGVWVRQPGSHADAGWLKINRPNDYSLRGTLQQNGPQQYGRAWDWTFPSAQAGNYDEIVKYSARIREAWNNNDPRTYPLFEVLCEADNDYDPEGFVFYPTKSLRKPDRTHKWHIHLGILTTYINNWPAMQAIYGIIAGIPWGQTQQSTSIRKDPIMFFFANLPDGPRWSVVSGAGWFEFETQEDADHVMNALGAKDGEKRSAEQCSVESWNRLKAEFTKFD